MINNKETYQKFIHFTDKDIFNYLKYETGNAKSPFGEVGIDFPLVSVTMTSLKSEDCKFSTEDISSQLNKIVNELPNSLEFNRLLPEGANESEYYSDIIQDATGMASMMLYDKTKRYKPNFVIVSSDIIPILNCCDLFEGCCDTDSYKAGSLECGIDVFVEPNLYPGIMVFGCRDEMHVSLICFEKGEELSLNAIGPLVKVLVK